MEGTTQPAFFSPPQNFRTFLVYGCAFLAYPVVLAYPAHGRHDLAGIFSLPSKLLHLIPIFRVARAPPTFPGILAYPIYIKPYLLRYRARCCRIKGNELVLSSK